MQRGMWHLPRLWVIYLFSYVFIYSFILHCFRCHDWVLNPESADFESGTFAIDLSRYREVVDHKYDTFWTIDRKRNAPPDEQKVIYGFPGLSMCRRAGYDVIHISHDSHTSRFLSGEQQPFCQQLSEHQLCQHSAQPAVRLTKTLTEMVSWYSMH